MIVAQARHRRATGGIEIAPAIAVDDIAALAAHRDRVALLGVAVKYVCHGV